MKKTINIIFAIIMAVFYFGLKASGQDSVTDVNTVADEVAVVIDENSEVDLLGSPDRDDRQIEIPDELKDRRRDYISDRETLRDDLRARIDGLEDPTREDVCAEIDTFKRENADRIEAQRERAARLRGDIADWREKHQNHKKRRIYNARTNQGDDNTDPSIARRRYHAANGDDEVNPRRRAYNAQRDEMNDRRRAFQAQLDDAPSEERARMIEEHREENRQRHRELKESRRQQREEIRDDLSSDRRPDES
jgi:hypothetical protein